MKSDLVGRKVVLMISDPWDFGTACGAGPFSGWLADLEERKNLMLLERPIKFSNVIYKTAVGQLRHEGTWTDDLTGSTRLPINVTLLAGSATSLPEVDQELSDQGFAAMGTIELS